MRRSSSVSRPAVLAGYTPPEVSVGLETHRTADLEVGATDLRIGSKRLRKNSETHVKLAEGMLAGAEQAAERGLISGDSPQNNTSVAKATADSIVFVPGMNPRPTARMSFSADCEARSDFARFAARLNRPRKKACLVGERPEKRTSVAKATADFIVFIPGINPRPTTRMSFSAACKVVLFQNIRLVRGLSNLACARTPGAGKLAC